MLDRVRVGGHTEESPGFPIFLFGFGQRQRGEVPRAPGSAKTRLRLIEAAQSRLHLLAIATAPGSARRLESFSVLLRPDPLAHPLYRLAHPVLLRVSDLDRDGVFVASDDFSAVYGAGDTPVLAVQDYEANLFEHFEGLEEDEAILGPGLRRELFALRRYVVPKS